MKSLMTALALIISSVSYAADSLKVRQTEPELSDIYVALESLGITMYRFDLKDFLSARYNVSVYVDEFADGEKTSGSHEFSLGTNIESLKGFDETEQDYIRERYDIPEDSYEWNRITDITIQDEGPRLWGPSYYFRLSVVFFLVLVRIRPIPIVVFFPALFILPTGLSRLEFFNLLKEPVSA